jgi:signal transduction histidine kinase
MSERAGSHWHQVAAVWVLAASAATPGVLSVISEPWPVVVARAAYGIPLLWCLRRPAAAFWSLTVLILVSEVWIAAVGQASGEWAFVPLTGAAFVLGLRASGGRQLLGVAGFVVVVATAVVANLATAAPDRWIGLSPVVTLGLVGVSWVVGLEVHRGRARAELAEKYLHLEQVAARDRARSAVLEERLRIAQDLHDVASHNLTALVIRTEAARTRVGSADQELTREIRGIGDDGRRAMHELRTMLRLFRAEMDENVGLHDVLCAEVTSSAGRGGSVGLESSEQLPILPGDVADTLRRFVREALVNAHRHAPLARVGVTARLTATAIIVAVRNDPPPRGSGSASATGSRLGLVTARERVQRLDGTLVAGATRCGGFEAVATLPWPPGPPLQSTATT